MEIIVLDQILCSFLTLCQYGHYLFSLSQMKACSVRKTNTRFEFSALINQKENNCLFAADLDGNLHWRVDTQIAW